MFKLTIFAVMVALAAATTDDANWLIFKKTYNKAYSGKMDVMRRFIWQTNMKMVEEHNALYAQGKSSYFMGENQFADMTTAEFAATMNGVPLNSSGIPDFGSVREYTSAYLPDTVDWRTKGYVTPVKNQGQCGSCWSFSTTGSIEGQHFKATGNLVSLSESNLVDCCTQAYSDYGCNGGWITTTMQCIIDKKGIDTEASYPYVPSDEPCTFNPANIGATISSYKNIQSGSEAGLKEAAANVGPISVLIDASHESFQMYRGGVYDEPSCSSTDLDHAVLVVGYGTDSGSDYWLVKNSWSTSWGMNGYIMMSRNKNNQCGIATKATYPIV